MANIPRQPLDRPLFRSIFGNQGGEVRRQLVDTCIADDAGLIERNLAANRAERDHRDQSQIAAALAAIAVDGDDRGAVLQFDAERVGRFVAVVVEQALQLAAQAMPDPVRHTGDGDFFQLCGRAAGFAAAIDRLEAATSRQADQHQRGNREKETAKRRHSRSDSVRQ